MRELENENFPNTKSKEPQTIMEKEGEDKTAKTDESHAPKDSVTDATTQETGKKRKADEDADENADESAKKKKSDEVAGVETKEDEEKTEKEESEAPVAEDTADAQGTDEQPKEDGNNADDPPAPDQEQQQQAAAAAAAVAMGNPFLSAGMPLAAVPGLDPSSPHAALLLAQQQGQAPAFGAPGFAMANPAFQVAASGQPQQGQEQAAAAGAQAMQFNPAALSQLYAQQGVGAAQMMMMGGFNPFMAMRPFMAGGIDPATLASAAAYRSPAVPLSLPCDEEHLSEYQIMVRQQLELFEAEQEDVDSNTQGRKKAVTLGQVGLRCKHCAVIPLRQRGKGSVYYPTKLAGIYQAAQNMASSHLVDACQCIDERMKVTLLGLRQRRDTASGGKQYWADGAKAVGLYETEDGLRLNRGGVPAQVQQQIQQQQS